MTPNFVPGGPKGVRIEPISCGAVLGVPSASVELVHATILYSADISGARAGASTYRTRSGQCADSSQSNRDLLVIQHRTFDTEDGQGPSIDVMSRRAETCSNVVLYSEPYAVCGQSKMEENVPV